MCYEREYLWLYLYSPQLFYPNNLFHHHMNLKCIWRIVDRYCIFIFPGRLVIIYLCHIKYVMFMLCFPSIFQYNDCLMKLFIVYSYVTLYVCFDKTAGYLIIVSLLCWRWLILSFLYWWCHECPLIRNVKLIQYISTALKYVKITCSFLNHWRFFMLIVFQFRTN